jgi:hypothetical protein
VVVGKGETILAADFFFWERVVVEETSTLTVLVDNGDDVAPSLLWVVVALLLPVVSISMFLSPPAAFSLVMSDKPVVSVRSVVSVLLILN